MIDILAQCQIKIKCAELNCAKRVNFVDTFCLLCYNFIENFTCALRLNEVMSIWCKISYLL